MGPENSGQGKKGEWGRRKEVPVVAANVSLIPTCLSALART